MVPFIISHAHHAYVLLFLPYTGLSQSVLLVPIDWGIWASPPETDQDTCLGGYHQYHLILSPPRRASLLVPLPLDLSTSLPPEFCPLLLCFLCGTWHRTFMWNHCQLEEFINQRKIKFKPVKKFNHNIWGLYSQCHVFSCVFMFTVVGLVGVSCTDWEVLG